MNATPKTSRQDLAALAKIASGDPSFLGDHSPTAIHQTESLIRKRLATYSFETGLPVATDAGLLRLG